MSFVSMLIVKHCCTSLSLGGGVKKHEILEGVQRTLQNMSKIASYEKYVNC